MKNISTHFLKLIDRC